MKQVALSTISLLFAWLAAAMPLVAAEKMNILIVTVDDMNCDSLGAYGCAVPDTTPNLDQFAKESLVFQHAHVHATSCAPSRGVVMTGRYLYNSGLTGFFKLPPEQVEFKTLPETLQQQGYFPMILGKAQHSSPYYPFPAWEIDFDPIIKQQKLNSRSPQVQYDLTKQGIQAAQKAGKPFFFSVNIYDPHTPLYSFAHKAKDRGVPSTKLNRTDIDNPPSKLYKDEEIVMPGFLPDTPVSRKEMTAYYNCVRRADDQFAAVVKAVKDTGAWDNTVVVFFSDHGMPFTFAKTTLYYHGTHTPLMVRWPGVTQPGAWDTEHVVGTVDLLPTLAEAAGAEQPEGLDGRSLTPILRGEKQPDRDFVYVMYEENVGGNYEPMRGVTSKDHAYIWSPWVNGRRKFVAAAKGMATTAEMIRLGAEGDADVQARYDLWLYGEPEQFFDLKTDADALNNLVDDSDHQDLVEQYRKQMVAFMESSGDPLLKIFPNRHKRPVVEAYLREQQAESDIRQAPRRKELQEQRRRQQQRQKAQEREATAQVESARAASES